MDNKKSKKELSESEKEAKAKRIGTRRKHEMTREEEREEIRKAQAGDKDAMQKLINVNEKYIYSFVRRRKNETELKEEDLKQEAMLGFMEAVRKYNLAGQSVKLVTYAHFLINGTLNSAVQKSKSIKISQYGFARYRKINQFIAEETKKTGNQPTMEQISSATTIPLTAVDNILSVNNVFSLDMTLNEGEENTSSIDINSDKIEYNKEKTLFDELCEVVEKLPELYKNILKEYYGLYGVKKVRISELKKKYSLEQEQIEEILQEIYAMIKENF